LYKFLKIIDSFILGYTIQGRGKAPPKFNVLAPSKKDSEHDVIEHEHDAEESGGSGGAEAAAAAAAVSLAVPFAFALLSSLSALGLISLPFKTNSSFLIDKKKDEGYRKLSYLPTRTFC
jgi:hypothetical protein